MAKIVYTDNSLPNGDFPNFKTMKERHPEYEHFFFCCDSNGYMAEIYKNDEQLKNEWNGSDIPDFELCQKKFKIYRYAKVDDEVVEEHFGAEIIIGGHDRNPTTYHFDNMKDAAKFIKVMLKAYNI